MPPSLIYSHVDIKLLLFYSSSSAYSWVHSFPPSPQVLQHSDGTPLENRRRDWQRSPLKTLQIEQEQEDSCVFVSVWPGLFLFSAKILTSHLCKSVEMKGLIFGCVCVLSVC